MCKLLTSFSGFLALLSAKICDYQFLIAFALTGKNDAIRFMFSAEGRTMYSLHSLLIHISWLSSIPTECQARPRILTVNQPFCR